MVVFIMVLDQKIFVKGGCYFWGIIGYWSGIFYVENRDFFLGEKVFFLFKIV